LADDQRSHWKVLIVDDDLEVFRVSEMVLKELEFEGLPLQLLYSKSKEDALEMLRKQNDIAVLLLDVVMESDTAGLELVNIIRKDLQNHDIKILLRTGQPGHAPERKVIDEYDIDDYLSKSELSTDRLITSIKTSLRAFRHLEIIAKQAKIIERDRKFLMIVVSIALFFTALILFISYRVKDLV
jgi:CheY-like chemotaxis protein